MNVDILMKAMINSMVECLEIDFLFIMFKRALFEFFHLMKVSMIFRRVGMCGRDLVGVMSGRFVGRSIGWVMGFVEGYPGWDGLIIFIRCGWVVV
jgi:hypothetical protein